MIISMMIVGVMIIGRMIVCMMIVSMTIVSMMIVSKMIVSMMVVSIMIVSKMIISMMIVGVIIIGRMLVCMMKISMMIISVCVRVCVCVSNDAEDRTEARGTERRLAPTESSPLGLSAQVVQTTVSNKCLQCTDYTHRTPRAPARAPARRPHTRIAGTRAQGSPARRRVHLPLLTVHLP